MTNRYQALDMAVRMGVPAHEALAKAEEIYCWANETARQKEAPPAPPSEHNEGPFTWAVSQLKAGKKVRRRGWSKGHFAAIEDGAVVKDRGGDWARRAVCLLDDLTAWDWELAE